MVFSMECKKVVIETTEAVLLIQEWLLLIQELHICAPVDPPYVLKRRQL